MYCTNGVASCGDHPNPTLYISCVDTKCSGKLTVRRNAWALFLICFVSHACQCLLAMPSTPQCFVCYGQPSLAIEGIWLNLRATGVVSYCKNLINLGFLIQLMKKKLQTSEAYIMRCCRPPSSSSSLLLLPLEPNQYSVGCTKHKKTDQDFSPETVKCNKEHRKEIM